MFLRGETYGAPFGLQRLDLLCSIVPLFVRLEVVVFDLSRAVDERLFLLQVLLFLGVNLVEIFLVTFVDDRAGLLEAVPELLA